MDAYRTACPNQVNAASSLRVRHRDRIKNGETQIYSRTPGFKDPERMVRAHLLLEIGAQPHPHLRGRKLPN